MLLELYPRVHDRYTSLPIIGPTLDGYGTWLLKQGTRPTARASTSARRLDSRASYSDAACGRLTASRGLGCGPVRQRIRKPIPISRRWCVNWTGISRPSCRCIRHQPLTRIEQRDGLHDLSGAGPWIRAFDLHVPSPDGDGISDASRLREDPDAARGR